MARHKSSAPSAAPAALRLALALCTLFGSAAAFDLLAATSLMRCVDTGVGVGGVGGVGGGVGNCSLVMVVTGALQNGEADGSGGLLYDLAAAPPQQLPGGDGFTAVSVADAVSIALFQSAITLRYPTTYVQDENDAPTEAVFLTDGGGVAFGIGNECKDAPTDASVGCGWIVGSGASGGAHVPFSQGFCCRCSVADSLVGTFIPRSGQTCAFAQRRDSAHCLRMAPLWHSAYAVGSPSLDFLIVLTVLQCRPTPAALAAATNATAAARAAARCEGPGPGCECATLNSAALGVPLGPRQPTRCFALPFNANQAACDIEVRLQGTFVAYEGTPDFSDRLLLVPTLCAAATPPTDPCWQRLVEPPEHWLVAERASVSVAGGSECNKVGAGYEAFATQGAACASPRGTCLANQPRDLYAADVAAAAAGRATTSFLSGFREASAPAGDAGAPMLDASAAELLAARTAPRSLSLATRRFQKSLISLTFRADPGSLRLVVKASAGRILSADAPPWPAGSAGVLTVLMQSTGGVASHFTVSLDCAAQAAVQPAPARDLSVAAGANASAVFALLPVASTASATGSCSVVLVSALGVELDRSSVAINQSAALRVTTGQGGTHVGGNGAGAGAANASSSGSGGMALCGSACASVFDLVCAAGAAASCVRELSGWSVGLGLGALLLALVACKQPALLLAPLRAAAQLCCAGGSAPAKRPRAEAEPEAGAAGTGAGAEAPAAATAPARPRGKRRAAPAPGASKTFAGAGAVGKFTAAAGAGASKAEDKKFSAALAARPDLDGPTLIALLLRTAPQPPRTPRAVAVDVDEDPASDAAAPQPRGRGRDRLHHHHHHHHHHRHRERREDSEGRGVSKD